MILHTFLSLVIAPLLWQVPVAEVEGPQRIYTDLVDVELTAQSAIALDIKSNKILYQKNQDQVRSIASITKLMTAMVFIEHNPGWQKDFYTQAVDRKNGGIIHLNTGEIITIHDLFKTALIASDNDAAAALARSTGLSNDQFIAQMNYKAKELGLTQTRFSDPTGLNNSNESTAQEVAYLLKAALEKDMIREISKIAYDQFEVQVDEDETRTVTIRTTNQLLRSHLKVVGGKTGFLEEAGYCLAVKIEGPDKQEVILVVLGSDTAADRFQDIKAIAEFIFTNYKWS